MTHQPAATMTPKDELPELPEDALPDLPDSALPELPDLPDPGASKAEDESTVEKIAELPDMPPEREPIKPEEPAPIDPPKPDKPTPPVKSPPAPKEPAPVTPPRETPPPAPAPSVPPPGPATPRATAPEPKPAPEAAAAAPAAMEAPDPSTKRDLEGAPKHLQKAALIAIAGGLLPWHSFGHAGPVTWVAGKLLLLLGGWLLWKSVDYRSKVPVPGFIASLGKLELIKKKEVDPKVAARRASRQTGPTKLEVPFPTALHVVGLALLVLACLAPLFDPSHAERGEAVLKSVAELGMLAWAVGTWIHIYAFERWASFNPIYPMIFIGLLVAGFQRAIESVTHPEGLQPIGLLGGLAVGVAGGMAAYTIVESMMQAKREGDAKKQLEIERRKAARGARKSD